jgi:hypothetical protein
VLQTMVGYEVSPVPDSQADALIAAARNQSELGMTATLALSRGTQHHLMHRRNSQLNSTDIGSWAQLPSRPLTLRWQAIAASALNLLVVPGR